MKLSSAVFVLCCLLSLDIDPANAASAAHTVRGVVITTNGTVVPEFTVVIKHVSNRPELFERKHFKNGEFTISDLKDDRYQLHITSSQFVGTRLDFDFKRELQPTNYCIVILHSFRNEARLAPGGTYTVSVKTLQEKVPDLARDAYLKGVEL